MKDDDQVTLQETSDKPLNKEAEKKTLLDKTAYEVETRETETLGDTHEGDWD